MFGEYAQVATYLQPVHEPPSPTEYDTLPAYLRPNYKPPQPWGFGKGKNGHIEDFVMVAEFSELEGPKPVMTIPKDGGTNFDQNTFAVRILAVDHQTSTDGFSISEDAQVVLSDSETGVFAFVHHLVLFDNTARGFVRPFCIAYVTVDQKKLMYFYEELSLQFKKVARYIKYGNRMLFVGDLETHLKDLEYTKGFLLNQMSKMRLRDSGGSSGQAQDLRKNAENELYKDLQTIRQSSTEIKEILTVLKPLLSDRRLEARFKLLEDRAFTRSSPSGQDKLSLQEYWFNDLSSLDELDMRCGSLTEPRKSPLALFKPREYKPVLVETKKAKRFNAPLRGLHELCSWGAKEGLKKLRHIHEYFKRDLAILELEKNESRLLRPSFTSVSHGQCITGNFLSDVHIKKPFESSAELDQDWSMFHNHQWGSLGSVDSMESFKSADSHSSLIDPYNTSPSSYHTYDSHSANIFQSVPSSPEKEIYLLKENEYYSDLEKYAESDVLGEESKLTFFIGQEEETEEALQLDTINSRSLESGKTLLAASGNCSRSCSEINEIIDSVSTITEGSEREISLSSCSIMFPPDLDLGGNEDFSNSVTDQGVLNSTLLVESGQSEADQLLKITKRNCEDESSFISKDQVFHMCQHFENCMDNEAHHCICQEHSEEVKGDKSKAILCACNIPKSRGRNVLCDESCLIASCDTKDVSLDLAEKNLIAEKLEESNVNVTKENSKLLALLEPKVALENDNNILVNNSSCLLTSEPLSATSSKVISASTLPSDKNIVTSSPSLHKNSRLLDNPDSHEASERRQASDSSVSKLSSLLNSKPPAYAHQIIGSNCPQQQKISPPFEENRQRSESEASSAFTELSMRDLFPHLLDSRYGKGHMCNSHDPYDADFLDIPSSVNTGKWKPRNGVYAVGDWINNLSIGRPGYCLSEVLSNYQNMQHVIFSLLSGRPVLIVGLAKHEPEVVMLVNALSVFVPSAKRKRHSVLEWTSKPLRIADLTKLKLVGVCRPERRSNDIVIPSTIKKACTIVDAERKLIIAPLYQGQFITTLLSRKKALRTDIQLLSFTEWWLMDIFSKAFIFFHFFCLGSAGSYVYPKDQRDTYCSNVSGIMARLGVKDSDCEIVEYLTEIVKLSRMEPHIWHAVDSGSIVYPITLQHKICQTYRC